MVKNTYEINLMHSDIFTEGWSLVDIETEGKFWRSSKILAARVIEYGKPCTEHEWIAENGTDEYDILSGLSQKIMQASNIMTFNGTSFDIPYLRRKYKAYRVKDPMEGKDSLDLMRALMPYRFLFPLECHRLADYLTLFKNYNSIRNDTEGALLASSLLDLFWVFESINEIPIFIDVFDKHINVAWTSKVSIPISFDILDGVYHLFYNEGQVTLSIYHDGTMLKRYYPDYKNYYYLPNEGYSIHQSLSAYVAANRKEKAVRENCFSLIPISSLFPDNEKNLKQYTMSVLNYMKRDISLPTITRSTNRI